MFADEASIALPITGDRHDPQRGTRLRQPETCAPCSWFISPSHEPGHHQLTRIAESAHMFAGPVATDVPSMAAHSVLADA